MEKQEICDAISNNNNHDGVVYTCITGGYDKLIEQEYKFPNYRYICFTDNKELISKKHSNGWEIFPLCFDKLDNTRNNRWHKVHPHKLFKDFSQSVYIDSNINILTPYLYETIKEKNQNIIIPKHFARTCVYKECKACIASENDTETNINKMVEFLRQENMPENYGLNENCIIYRRHNSSEIVKMMEEWWNFIENYTKRDQLSLSYVLYKNGIKPDDIAINNARFDEKNFLFVSHSKKNSSGFAIFSIAQKDGRVKINILGMKLNFKITKE